MNTGPKYGASRCVRESFPWQQPQRHVLSCSPWIVCALLRRIFSEFAGVIQE